MSAPPILVITGPTAVGKSELADRIAECLGISVLSADAMQVYRGLDIGTAKTPPHERRAPLELIDLADPDEPYTAALYQRDARQLIDFAQLAGTPVLICGGTGLYISAAIDEMEFPKGAIGDGRREQYQALLQDVGSDGLHQLLAKRDPKSAELIHPNNTRRTIRALEMCDEGLSYADQVRGFSHLKPHYDARIFMLTRKREVLYHRINERVDAMMAAGLLEEVATLMEQGLGEALTAQQAIGYKELIAYLEGTVSLEEAVETIKLRSRRYAKRQLAWWRRDPRSEWIDVDEYADKDLAAVILDRWSA
ncbi:tRNA (adenosine(37)-N6)-dimethylallyltransferase MiaA [Collinsella sp. AGMB00827]|uniref:tRNA dimethylallyltransferase n=1 Tax=Collinsella ureilytica TaxID=2869515 RepID=A0ABS7MKV1_9ACTN|nr:tRNA (adenosine(37)-N6)-dimethylallyltransferase MiaA [Collinsella urealyticum]MBY4797994.1 tRNA (adenosine(37)-N6)-dimethylallyltransferase MiaA [Collinsella urealyticum]